MAKSPGNPALDALADFLADFRASLVDFAKSLPALLCGWCIDRHEVLTRD